VKLPFHNIPESMRTCNQWVLWKTVTRNGEPTKVPFQVNGSEAKSNTPATWTEFNAVVKRYGQGGFDGIGFMFSAQDDFVGVDLDGCRNPATGEWSPWGREVINRFNSYTELSPSRTGAKIFVIGKSPFQTGKNIRLPDAPVVSEKAPGIEVYSALRYFAVTGWRLLQVSIAVEPRQDALQWLADKFFPVKQAISKQPAGGRDVVSRARKYLEKVPPAVSGRGGHNQAYAAACAMVLGFGLSDDEAFGLLSEWNTSCQPPWSEGELRHKIADAQKMPGPRNYLRDAQRDTGRLVGQDLMMVTALAMADVEDSRKAAELLSEELKRRGLIK